MENQPTVKKKYRLDIIIISAILLFSVGLLLVSLLSKEVGNTVVVEIDGRTVATYSLNQNGEYSLNGGTNVLKIENGEAWMIEANCPTLGDTRCTAQGKISKTTESIYCQPNNVLVTVHGGEMPDVELVS
jgi:hypothetical protein